MPRASRRTATESKPKPPLIIEKSAGAVVFHRGSQLHYLLIKSSYWEFPKGLIDNDESESQAALREVREETGLRVELVPGFRHAIQYFYRRKDGSGLVKKSVIYFLAEADSEHVKLSWEHLESAWLTFEQALAQLPYENARAILTAAHAQVTGAGDTGSGSAA